MQTNFHLTTAGGLPSAQARYAYQCFPVRNVKYNLANAGGAWLVEYKALKQNDVKKSIVRQNFKTKTTTELTGFYLVKQCHVDKPEDICILNISGKNLSPDKGEDFSLFKNIVHIDASDNEIPFETFTTFPNLEHLELQVNCIKDINISHQHFTSLKKLDLSYNSLDHTALLNLGKLRNIEELRLRGCGLKSLPPHLARGYQVSDNDSEEKKLKAEKKTRFPQLTNLDLSENELTDLTTFASLAGLRKLATLNLSCNKISGVPHLRLMAAHRHFSMSTFAGGDDMKPESPEAENEDENEENGTTHNDDEVVAQIGDINIDEVSKRVLDDLSDTDVHSDDAENEEEEEEQTKEDDGVLEGIEETISRISSNKDAEDTNDLLNMNFAQELNFGLNMDLLLAEEGGGESGDKDETFSEKDGMKEPIASSNPVHEDPFLNTAKELLDEDLKRPFPCLESVDLSYNHISCEESLLALTSWPVLQELKLWGNPLMRAYKSIPPVIFHHLKVMCGVNIIRKEPTPQPKHLPVAPGLVNSIKVHKVKDEIPPIKRNNLMMIENMILQAIENKSGDFTNSNDKNKMKTDDADGRSNREKEKEEEFGDTKDFGGDDKSSNFFMTQVDEEGLDLTEQPSDQNIQEEDESKVSNNTKSETQGHITDLKELLKIDGSDDEDSFVIPQTVQGSVHALRHLLNNELVFNDGHYNKSKKKSIIFKSEKQRAPRDDVNDALDAMRTGDQSYEENLAVVLDEYKNNPGLRNKFPQAKQMVKRVQQKYDHVRLNSLKPVSEAQEHLKKLSTRAEHPSQELVLSRMRKGKIGDFYTASRGNTARVKIRGTRYDKYT